MRVRACTSFHTSKPCGITIKRFAAGAQPSSQRNHRTPSGPRALHHALYNSLMLAIAFRGAARVISVALFLGLTFVPVASIAQTGIVPASRDDRAEARDIFKQLIEINTTDTPQGSVTAGTEAMEKRFLDAGFPREDVNLLGPDPRKQNLIVRLRASAP